MEVLEVRTRQREELVDITGKVQDLVRGAAVQVGVLHLWSMHTTCALTVNENADPSVRSDMEAHFTHHVPERAPYYRHTQEGDDDMPAHLKSTIIGAGLLVPIANGRLALGTWQGFYLCEHRDRGGSRRIVATLHGEG